MTSTFPLLQWGHLEMREMRVDVHPHSYLGKVHGVSSWVSTLDNRFFDRGGVGGDVYSRGGSRACSLRDRVARSGDRSAIHGDRPISRGLALVNTVPICTLASRSTRCTRLRSSAAQPPSACAGGSGRAIPAIPAPG